MSPPVPRVAVVVSTYNRPDQLARLLDALRAQSLGADRFEVVVVDNGSAPPVAGRLPPGTDEGLTVRWIRHELTRGPAGGRNSGWRAARAPLVAFTDDDCRPTPGWLETVLRTSAEHPDAVIQGPTRPDPAELDADGVFSHTVRVERLGPYYETCNIIYPRHVLERLGGFDESFGLLPAGEDTDLAWRAIESGSPTVFAADAVVHHAVERIGPRRMLRIAGRWGPAVRVLSDHPQTRAWLYRGLFWNVWHYLLLRSLLAMLGPAWLRRLLHARHVRELRARAMQAGAGPWAIPFLLVYDAVECQAIVRGAVRHRTPVV